MFKRTKPIIVGLCMGIMMLIPQTFAAVGTSATYQLEIADITNNGSADSSTTYSIDAGVVGDNFDGTSSSASYKLCAGYVEEAFGACNSSSPPPPPPPTPPPPPGGGRPDDYVPPGPPTPPTPPPPPPTPTPSPVPQPEQPSPIEISPEISFPILPNPFEIILPKPGEYASQNEDENQPYCEVLSCYGKPVQINKNLKGAAIETEAYFPVPGSEATLLQIMLIFGLFGLAILLSPYYDQRVARMLKAKLPTVAPHRKKSTKR